MTTIPISGKTQHLPSPDEYAVQTIDVHLTERRRRSGDTFSVAACDFAEDASTAGPICGLARKLVALGIDPATMLSIRRGRVKCFDDAPISVWARLTVSEGPSGTVFAPYVPFSGIPVVSQGAKSDV